MQNPKQMENAKKIVMAGMKLMYSQQGRQLLIEGLKSEKPTPEKLAEEVVGLLTVLFDKSGGSMPPDAIPGATAILIYEVAGFMKESGVEVSKEDVQQGIVIAMKMLPPVFKDIRSKNQGAQQPQAPQPPQQPQGGLIQQPMGAM